MKVEELLSFHIEPLFSSVLYQVLPRPRQSKIWVRDEFYLGPLKQLTYSCGVYIAMVDYKRQIHFPFLCGLNKEDLHCKQILTGRQ